MQNNHSKVNTILLVIVIILLAVGIWILAGKSEREPRIESEPEVILQEQPQEKEEEKPAVVQQKPTATTLAFMQQGGSSCMLDPDCDTPDSPLVVNIVGSYDGHTAKTTTWFEYWTTGGIKHSTVPVVQATFSGSTGETIPGQPYPISYRFVAQNSAGTTYGETKTIAIAVP